MMTTINLPQEKQEAPETEAEMLMTVDEFERRYIDKPYELWEGRVVKIAAVGGWFGTVMAALETLLGNFVKERALGQSLSLTCFRLSTATLFTPDIAFVGQTKMASIQGTPKYLPFTPDLAIRAVSPKESASDWQKRLELYRLAQTPLVWEIWLDKPRVVVYEIDRQFRVVPLTGVLDGGMVLPGLQIKVADLFPTRIVPAKSKESRESKKPANPVKEG